MSLRLAIAMAVSAVTALAGVLAAGASVGGGLADAPQRIGPPRPPSQDDAASFARRVVRLIAENRYDEAWPLLHPTHRSAAPRREYVDCERQSPIPGRVVSLRAGTPVEERVVLEREMRVPSRAVPVTVVLLDLATSESTSVNVRIHAVSAEGGWRWVLPQKRLAQYLAGRCPDAPPKRYD